MGLNPGWQTGYIPTAEEWAGAFAAKIDDLGYVFSTPSSGTTLTSVTRQGGWVLDPVAELSSLTIVAPMGEFDRQRFTISTSQTIDSLIINPSGGQILKGGGPTILAENGVLSWIYRLANTTWYPWA